MGLCPAYKELVKGDTSRKKIYVVAYCACFESFKKSARIHHVLLFELLYLFFVEACNLKADIIFPFKRFLNFSSNGDLLLPPKISLLKQTEVRQRGTVSKYRRREVQKSGFKLQT